jgi:uncharacterized integral membrane protein
MIILFIIGLLLGAVSVIFALQNIDIVTVTFFSWHLTGSLALILLLTIAAGILVPLLLILPSSVMNYFRYKKLEKENKKLVEDLRKQKELTIFAKTAPIDQEAISSIDHGAMNDIATN